jgi:hypothetical protein
MRTVHKTGLQAMQLWQFPEIHYLYYLGFTPCMLNTFGGPDLCHISRITELPGIPIRGLVGKRNFYVPFRYVNCLRPSQAVHWART